MRLLLFSSIYWVAVASLQSVHDDRKLDMVIAGYRHGMQNPAKFFADDPNDGKWGHEGPMQLNAIGKRQSFAVGQHLRERYGNFLPDLFNLNQTEMKSSSEPRALMSSQLLMAGLYPPMDQDVWQTGFPWQPTPVTTADEMLGPHGKVKCPVADAAWSPISRGTSEKLFFWLKNEKLITGHIASNTGWDVNVENLADAAANLDNLVTRKLPVPRWIFRPDLPGVHPKSLEERILSFLEAPQRLCASDSKCRDIMAGYWLNEIVNLLKKKQDGQIPEKKLSAYVTHTEVILSLLQLLKVDTTVVPPSGGFILEFSQENYPAVRILLDLPSKTDPTKRVLEVAPLTEGCAIGNEVVDWCPLETFIEKLSSKIIADRESACGTQKCPINSLKAESTKIVEEERKTNCDEEIDESGSVACAGWVQLKYCEKYDAIKYLYCRRSCACLKM